MSRVVGFCGSRSLSGVWFDLAGRVASSFASSGASVVVGCALGCDLAVRSAVPSASVFSLAFRGRGAFASRSSAVVRASSSGLVGFVSSPCPVGLLPSPSASRCFSGFGSGSWASLAFAVGLGRPVVVFCCSSVPFALPSWGCGSWVRVSSGPCVGGWLWSPLALL